MTTAYDTTTSPVSSDIVRQGAMSGGGAMITSSAVKLLGSSTSFSGSTTTVDLSFSASMAKGTGFIYITDGAVQTVIDRATGLPTIRIVGATETRKIAVGAADVQVSGNHVLVKADGLTPGHVYSVFMGEGVLTTSALQSFAGVTKPGTVAISVADTVAPTVLSMELSSTVLAANAPAELTITFSEAVTSFPTTALSAQGGSIASLRAVGDGKVWIASIATPGSGASSGNKIALDLAQVRDAAGNAGSGTYLSAAYVIDNGLPPTATIALSDTTLTSGESVEVTVTMSEPVASLGLDAFSAPHVTLSTPVSSDGGKTWKLTMTAASSGLNHADLALSLDMSKVTDTAGQAGSGSALSPGYAVDTRSTSDTTGPTVESITFSGEVLDASHDLVATIRFSEAVQDEGLLGALDADYASLSGLATSDGGRTWTVTLKLDDPDAEPHIGEFGVRLSQVRDLAGNPGTGFEPAPAYAVNTASSFIFLYDDGQSAEDGVVSGTFGRYFGGIVLGDFPNPASSFELTVGAEQIDNSEIAFHAMDGLLYWFYSGEGSWTQGSHDIVAKAVKADGTVVTTTKHVDVDTTAPLVVESPASGTTPPPFDIADSLVIQFNEAVYFTDDEPHILVATKVGTETVNTTIRIYSPYLSADRKTLTIPSGAHHLATGTSITLTLPDTEDLAGNRLTADSFTFTTTGAAADTAAPVAVGAALEGYDVAPVTTGGRVMFTITFNEAVTLFGDGERYVNLNNGGKAHVYGASMDGTELTFQYLVAAEDEDVERLAVNDLGSLVGQLKDAANNVLSSAHVDFGDLYLSGYGTLAVDQTPPAILGQPSIALASDSGTAGDYTTSVNKPTIVGSGAEPGARIQIKVGAATVTDYVVADDNGAWTWTPSTALAVGGHTLSFQQRDSAGNLSAPKTVDVSIEALPTPRLAVASDSGTSNSDGITSDGTPTYGGSGAVPNGTVALFAGHLEVGRAVADSAGAWSITVADANALIDGSYNVTTKLLGADGSVLATSGAHTIVVDATAHAVAPGAPILAATSDSGSSSSDGITNDTTPTYTGSGAVANSIVALFAGTREIGRMVADSAGAWSITVAAADTLAEGRHEITARHVDVAGNIGPASSVSQLVLDTTGPSLKSASATLLLREFELAFNEAIVFSPSGEFRLTENTAIKLNFLGSQASTSWSIKLDPQGVASLLNFKISMNGLFNMHMANGSIQDLAGNVALIGTPDWEVNLLPSY